MTTQELTIHPYVKVYMQSDEEVLEEVMVVAYGTAKKSAFTGSAADIKAEKIENRVVSNVTSALSGQMAGVQMTTAVGAPGSEPTIRIRGIGSMSASNAPLIILDGMPYDGSISSINPADIESMSVLKDAASSAIYSARGANGVVLINTKNGQSKNAQVTFDAKFGSNSRLIPQYDVITDAGQYYETHYKAMYNSQIYAGKSVADAYAYADANLYDKNNGGLGYRIFTVPEGEKLIGTNFKLNPNATLGYSTIKNAYRISSPYSEEKLLEAEWTGWLNYAPSPSITFYVSETDTTTNLKHITWDNYWFIGLNYQGIVGAPIKAYLPSSLDASLAANDVDSYVHPQFEEKFLIITPYYYIDGMGGFGLKPCYLSLPGGPDLNELLSGE